MEKLAICKECRFAFSFKPWGAIAPSLADSPAFCTRCGKEALVAEGDYSGFFGAYHSAFPSALSKRQKRDILDLAKRIVAGEVKEPQALAETTRDPETRQAFSVAAQWFFAATGAAGGVASVAAVVIMLDDQAEGRRNQAQIMQRLDEIAENGRLQLGDAKPQKPPKRSKRNRAKSPASAQRGADVPLAGNGRKRAKPTRRKRDPDVPLGE